MSYKNQHGQKNDSLKDELVFLASHELKNPLAAFSIQGRMIEYMLREEGLVESRERIINIIQNNERQVKRMERIIDEMIGLLDSQSPLFPGATFSRAPSREFPF